MLSRLFSSRTARALGAPVPRCVVLDAETLEVVAELRHGGRHGEVVAGADGVWISTPDDRSIADVAPDGAERLRVDLPGRPTSLALDGDRPVVLTDRGRIVRVEPAEGRIVDDVPAPDGASAVAAGAGPAWLLVAGELGRTGTELTLVQLDPATLAAVREIAIRPSRFYGDLQVHDGTVSVLHESEPGSMGYASFDAATGAPAATPPELERVRGIGEHDGQRWSRKDRSIRRIDIASGAELGSAQLEVPRVGGCTLAHGRIWAMAHRPAGHADNEDTD